jgi:hypothetical protein
MLFEMVKKPTNEAGHFHAVKFYENRESLCRIVAEFLGEGLITRQPALVIATPEHRAGILAELRVRHFDVDEMQAAGDLVLLDAAEMLATFMVDGMPDSELFFASATRAIEGLCRGRGDCTVRAYGEMVDVLWKSGQVAAIRLEMLWNKLAMTHDFALLCGYAMGNFYKDASLAEIHQQHSHVVAGQGLAALTRRTTAN